MLHCYGEQVGAPKLERKSAFQGSSSLLPSEETPLTSLQCPWPLPSGAQALAYTTPCSCYQTELESTHSEASLLMLLVVKGSLCSEDLPSPLAFREGCLKAAIWSKGCSLWNLLLFGS